MTLEIAVLDYSRPLQIFLQKITRCGTVHSIFRRAINLAFNDTLICLLSAELPHMPNGIRIPADVFATLVRQVYEGMAVRVENGHIFIATCHVYGHYGCWEPRPPVASHHWQRETVAQHVSILKHALSVHMPSEGLAPVLLDVGTDVSRPSYSVEPRWTNAPNNRVTPHARHEQQSGHDTSIPTESMGTPLARLALPWLRQLADASWRQDRAMLATAVSKLAGLGPGLTPSGDDVLGGFAAVMALLSPHLSVDGCERAWIAVLIAQIAGPRTTLISRVLLDYAAKGEVAEQIGDLLLALSLPLDERAIVGQAAERVLAFGATSGADTLLGILLALRVLEGGFDDSHMI